MLDIPKDKANEYFCDSMEVMILTFGVEFAKNSTKSAFAMGACSIQCGKFGELPFQEHVPYLGRVICLKQILFKLTPMGYSWHYFTMRSSKHVHMRIGQWTKTCDVDYRRGLCGLRRRDHQNARRIFCSIGRSHYCSACSKSTVPWLRNCERTKH